MRRQFPELVAAVTDADRAQAALQIQKTDGNGDGVVTEAEWVAAGLQPVERFRQNDLNKDGILTLLEHSMRWAQYRTARLRPGEAGGAAGATGQRSPPGDVPLPVHRSRQEEARRRQAQELAAYLLSLSDRDRNGAAERRELQSASLDRLSVADADGDGALAQPELAAWLLQRLEKQRGAGVPDGAPDWFLAADANLDGQVHLAEFLRVRPPSAVAQFEQHDHNGDGFVTARELAAPSGEAASPYRCPQPHVIEAERKTCAELSIREDVMIQDIDVRLAIAKNGDDDIELALFGPDGARADLYFDSRAKPWGGGRLFDNTVIDDEAPDSGQRLTRPPLHRSFRPQGMKTAGMHGLKVFYGKPARGTWRLVIYNKSQAAGLLEEWSLLIKPRSDTK